MALNKYLKATIAAGKGLSFFTWFILIIVVLIGYQITAALISTPPPAIELTPSQKAEAQAKNLRHNRVVMAGAFVKESLRDPDSLKWEALLANEDASVICLKYKANNGFGVAIREYTVIRNGTKNSSAKHWNRYCVNKGLINMALAKYDIR